MPRPLCFHATGHSAGSNASVRTAPAGSVPRAPGRPSRDVSKLFSCPSTALDLLLSRCSPLIGSGDDASSAGDRRPSRHLDQRTAPDRKRRQKTQEMPPVLAGIFGAMERFQQRQRQNDDLHNWHDATSCKFPKRRLRNGVAPEGLPSRDGRSVNTKQSRKLADSARRRTLSHGADQNHHGTKVDLSAEKTDRWRRHPLPAAVAIAAEAEPAAILLR